MVTLLAVGQATIVVRQGILRVDSNGLGVISDCFVEITFFIISIGPATIDFGNSQIDGTIAYGAGSTGTFKSILNISSTGTFTDSGAGIVHHFENGLTANGTFVDSSGGTAYNDASSYPNPQTDAALGHRHSKDGGSVMVVSGGVTFVRYKTWAQLALSPNKNSVWCNPGTVNGR